MLQEDHRVLSMLPAQIAQKSIAVQQRLQISKLHFDQFPTPSTFSCRKTKVQNQVTTCSDFPSEVVLWIKKVEMVDSVDELKNIAINLQFQNGFELIRLTYSQFVHSKIPSGGIWSKKISSHFESRS